MPASSSAQEALRSLGARLRDIRHEAGLSGRDIGRLTGWHSSKISKIEHGRQTPSVDDIRLWCKHCDATSQQHDLIASLHALEGLFVEWRRMERAGLRLAQEAQRPLWERTRNFRIYNPRLIPSPVQTGDYIATLLRGLVVRRKLRDDVDAAVAARLDRQRLVHEGNHRFAIVLEEAVLRFAIGGPETMAAQLGHLLTVIGLPSVSLGIIPLTADRTGMWPVEGFWMFDDKEVSAELVSGYLTVTQPHEIAMYARVFEELSKLAVYGAKARARIAAAIAATAEHL